MRSGGGTKKRFQFSGQLQLAHQILVVHMAPGANFGIAEINTVTAGKHRAWTAWTCHLPFSKSSRDAAIVFLLNSGWKPFFLLSSKDIHNLFKNAIKTRGRALALPRKML